MIIFNGCNMRNHLKIITCLTAFAVLFSNCSKLVYRHQDFMDSLKTKKDVISHFGGPSEYKLLGDSSKWLYNLNARERINLWKPDRINKNNSDDPGKNVSAFHYPKKMVLITFKNDSVLNYYSQGVDYSLRKPALLETAVVVMLGVGSVLGLSYLLLFPSGFIK